MRGAGLNASWSGVIPTMGLSVPVVMDPLCGIARGCDDIFAPGDGDHDDGDGWCRADAVCKCAEPLSLGVKCRKLDWLSPWWRESVIPPAAN